ncbi:MAG: hypothetical protein ABIR66_07185 [Saprospiraceae bacterium]
MKLSYDSFIVNAKNRYRITSLFVDDKDKKELALKPAPWAPIMKRDFPEIKEFVRLLKAEKTIIGHPGCQHLYDRDVLYTDSTFLKFFFSSS